MTRDGAVNLRLIGQFLLIEAVVVLLYASSSNFLPRIPSQDLLRPTSTNTEESYARHLPPAVPKVHTSNKARFLFVAALGGTGHHGWHQVLQDGVCERALEAENAMRSLWFGINNQADHNAALLQFALQQAAANATASTLYCLNLVGGSMLSYPNGNNPRHHPNVFSLAVIAERAQVDLRVLVLHRHPAPQLVSLSIHRHFMDLAAEAQQMATQGAVLNGQLQSIDPSFYHCSGFSSLDVQAINTHILGGMGFGDVLKRSVERNYRISVDNVTAAMKEMSEHETTGIDIKIDEMVVKYQQLLALCGR
jgi:hypothetical protein